MNTGKPRGRQQRGLGPGPHPGRSTDSFLQGPANPAPHERDLALLLAHDLWSSHAFTKTPAQGLAGLDYSAFLYKHFLGLGLMLTFWLGWGALVQGREQEVGSPEDGT